MSEFYKSFLTEGTKKSRSRKTRQVYLAGFGKHPGWDDHIEDIGLETETLVLAKKLLYLNGIGGQIDAGAWEKLDPDQQIPLFDHIFIWKRDEQFLMGRLWSSKDGKGRARYPMIACAQCVGLSLSWGIDNLLPRLEEIKRSCLGTDSAAEVESIFRRHLSDLRKIIETQPTEHQGSVFTIEGRKQFVSLPVFGADQEGLLRILYQLRSYIPSCNGEKNVRKAETGSARAEQIRLPRGVASAGEAILPWSNFVSSQIGSSMPQLFLIPCEGDWIDLIIGEASSSDFFCLRASPKSVSPVSDVPYNLDADFRAKAKDLIASFLRSSVQHIQSKQESPTPGTTASKSGVGLVIFLIMALIAGYGGYRFIAQEKSDNTVSPNIESPRDETPTSINKTIGSIFLNDTSKIVAKPDVPIIEEKPLVGEIKKHAIIKPEIEKDKDPVPRDKPSSFKSAEPNVVEQPVMSHSFNDLNVINSEPILDIPEQDVEIQKDVNNGNGTRLENSRVKEAEVEITPVTLSDLFTNTIGMELVKVPAGYWVGQFEVTQAEYEEVMGSNPSEFQNPRHPVESVNWDEAVEFCSKLTVAEREKGVISGNLAYSLPTESQWEFIAEGARFLGAVTSRSGTRKQSTSPVGSTKIPNKYNLYDVVGNVWEWCADSSTSERILKGGAYNSLTSLNFRPLSETTPWKRWRGLRDNSVGFRCILISENGN